MVCHHPLSVDHCFLLTKSLTTGDNLLAETLLPGDMKVLLPTGKGWRALLPGDCWGVLLPVFHKGCLYLDRTTDAPSFIGAPFSSWAFKRLNTTQHNTLGGYWRWWPWICPSCRGIISNDPVLAQLSSRKRPLQGICSWIFHCRVVILQNHLLGFSQSIHEIGKSNLYYTSNKMQDAHKH